MMNRYEFLELLEELHAKELELNQTKGKEYASDQDVLADIRATAEEMDLPMHTVLYIFMQKHWRAIQHYCRTGELLSESLRSRVLDLSLFSKLLLVVQAELDLDVALSDPYAAGAPEYGEDGRDD